VGARKGAEKKGKVNSDQRIATRKRPFVPQGDKRAGVRKGAEKKGKVNSDQRIATRKRPFVPQGDKRML